MRSTAATNALANGADIAKVQELLGHANLSTTRVYDQRHTHPRGQCEFQTGVLVIDHSSPCPLKATPWDYGEKGQQYPCWMVLKDTGSAAEIAYCEFGFGPQCPWGLVSSGDAPSNQHMGMDSGWYTCFLDAFFESYASVALPIWRVFDGEQPFPGKPLTAEGTWENTWKEVEARKKAHPAGRYFAHHSIGYGTSTGDL